eukprot:10571081-Alexandrium_andersonii.AAC.1
MPRGTSFGAEDFERFGSPSGCRVRRPSRSSAPSLCGGWQWQPPSALTPGCHVHPPHSELRLHFAGVAP